MRIKNIFLILVIGLLFMNVALAEDNFNPLPNSEKPFNLFYTLNHLGGFTVVNGATCNTFPSASGQPTSTLTLTCPTTDANSPNKGCSIDLWNGYYSSYQGQYHINAGSNFVVQGGKTYELYTCSDVTVSCGAETFGQCGTGGCAPGEVPITRTCTPPGGSWESTCVERSTCNPQCTENWDCSGWSDCSTSGKQTRTCSDLSVCGTSKSKPAEIQSCTPDINNPPTDPNPPITLYGIGLVGWLVIGLLISLVVIYIKPIWGFIRKLFRIR